MHSFVFHDISSTVKVTFNANNALCVNESFLYIILIFDCYYSRSDKSKILMEIEKLHVKLFPMFFWMYQTRGTFTDMNPKHIVLLTSDPPMTINRQWREGVKITKLRYTIIQTTTLLIALNPYPIHGRDRRSSCLTTPQYHSKWTGAIADTMLTSFLSLLACSLDWTFQYWSMNPYLMHDRDRRSSCLTTPQYRLKKRTGAIADTMLTSFLGLLTCSPDWKFENGDGEDFLEVEQYKSFNSRMQSNIDVLKSIIMTVTNTEVREINLFHNLNPVDISS